MKRFFSRATAMLTTAVIIFTAVAITACSSEQVRGPSDKYRNFYEIFVSSFYDSNDDGYGDLKGVTKKLPYLNGKKDSLGIDGIWLMPIMPSPTYHKYDVTDYYSIDPQYGTMADFEQLIEECDKRDIKLIIDLVLNHTSSQHKWFVSAKQSIAIPDCGKKTCTSDPLCSKHNKYCGYYNFSTEQKSGYHSVSMPSGYYYQGVFWDGMPDLNLDNEELRAELREIGKFWLNKGVAGFRLDATTEFYDKNASENTAFLSWFYDAMQEVNADVYMVGEAWTDGNTISEYYKGSGIDSFFNFPFSQGDGTIVNTIRKQQGNLFSQKVQDTQAAQQGIMANFFSNHDNARSSGYLMNNLVDMKLAASMYMLMPGNSFIYYGEEIGMNGSGIDENKRLPFLWSATNNKGIPKPPTAATQKVDTSVVTALDKQIKDKNSLVNFYKQIIKIKNENPAIARGKVEAIDSGVKELCVYKTVYEQQALYIVHNLSDSELTYELDGALSATLAPSGAEPKLSGKTLTMPAKTTAILKATP